MTIAIDLTVKLNRLNAWLARQGARQTPHAVRPRAAVTGDEVVAWIKKQWPTTTSEEIDWLYQHCNH